MGNEIKPDKRNSCYPGGMEVANVLRPPLHPTNPVIEITPSSHGVFPNGNLNSALITLTMEPIHSAHGIYIVIQWLEVGKHRMCVTCVVELFTTCLQYVKG